MKQNSTIRPASARQCRSVAALRSGEPSVEDMRIRIVLARAPLSPAVAAAVAELAYGSPETWKADR